MKKVLALTLTLLCTSPLQAQEDVDPPSLMEEGARQFLEGLLKEMEPALDGMMRFVEQMGPAMRDMLSEIQDWSVYEAPEVLPNGDIIIRKKPDPAPETPDTPEVPPQIEL